MDDLSFDRLTRRFVLGGVTAALGLGTARFPGVVVAKKRKKRKQKVKFNEFGCVNVGRFCKNDGQCCSDICQGKKGKKRCRAHDTGGCRAGQDSCLGAPVPCGMGRNCFRTTGKAGFCTAVAGTCTVCNRDPDCPEEDFGPGAACVVCASECPQTGGTACFPADV